MLNEALNKVRSPVSLATPRGSRNRRGSPEGRLRSRGESHRVSSSEGSSADGGGIAVSHLFPGADRRGPVRAPIPAGRCARMRGLWEPAAPDGASRLHKPRFRSRLLCKRGARAAEVNGETTPRLPPRTARGPDVPAVFGIAFRAESAAA